MAGDTGNAGAGGTGGAGTGGGGAGGTPGPGGAGPSEPAGETKSQPHKKLFKSKETLAILVTTSDYGSVCEPMMLSSVN